MDPYAVDNASNVEDPYDTHPCGPGPTLAHDWSDGECQTCGTTHPEDCVGCARQPVDPEHEYEWPEDDDEPEEPDGMYLAKVATEDRLMGLE